MSLSDFDGIPVVLYFYPKDDTPGCTVQACGLRDAWSDLSERRENLRRQRRFAPSHEKFIEKFQLPFPLLSDPEKEIVDAYGVWVEKSMYGKKYMGAERSTFVIDGAGQIAAIFRKVKPEEHVGVRAGSAEQSSPPDERTVADAAHPMLALRSGKPAS